MRWFFIILGILLAQVVLVVAGLWIVLAVPYFSDFRKSAVSDLLSDQLGQEVLVEDDVSVRVGMITTVRAAGVRIPSENIPDTMLAELDLLELDVDVLELLGGVPDLDNIVVHGLQVNALQLEDGTTSWTPLPEGKEEESPEPVAEITEEEATPAEAGNRPKATGNLAAFLRERTASFTDIGLVVENEVSGFAFDFVLESFTFEQIDGGERLAIKSTGTVNGLPFSLDSSYPRGAAFTNEARFGAAILTYNGIPEKGVGHTAVLDLDTGEFGDLLDVLGLKRVVEGTGTLNANIEVRPGFYGVEGLAIQVDLEKGQQIRAEGNVANILASEGFDVAVTARFHPEGRPHPPAESLADIKLVNFSTQIVGSREELELEEFLVATNAFDQGLDEVGPISIGRIRRTEEGTLAMEGIALQAGPRDAPYVVAEGNILDLLQLKELDVSGTLSAPASLVLKDLGEEVAERFGGVEATFTVDDSKGHLSLVDLDAKTVDTEVWSMTAEARLGNVEELEDIFLDLDLSLADGASFLAALNLEPIETGALRASASAEGRGTDFVLGFGIGADESQLDATFETTIEDKRPTIVGRIFSEQIVVEDIQKAVAGVVELGKIGKEKGQEAEVASLPVQPLVLPKEEPEPEDTREVQPLVLPKEEQSAAGLIDVEQIFLDTDLSVVLEIAQIVGIRGVTSLTSELVSKDGQARLGPVEVALDGGYASVSAEMDMREDRDLVTVSGATGGWDFGELLTQVGVGMDAQGILSASFYLTGSPTSGRAFLNSMYGSARVSMSQGRIATSLLELAGLGIFPWLFSTELQQGYTNIVCVEAPVRVENGSVNFDQVVVETESVQLVARGEVDWRDDQLELRVEPRRVGRPLGRTAVPFRVEGKLSDPKFRLGRGGVKLVRADGANEMPANRKPCVPDLMQLQ